jgi:glycosyltransferase involved in cell wall biosynthesis
VAAQVPGLLTLIPPLTRPIHPWRDVRALAVLSRILRRSTPHIVHTHSGKAGLIGRLAARRARVPLVLHTIHGPSFGAFQGALANLTFRAAERCAGRATHHFVVVANAMRDQYLAAGIGRPDQYTRLFSGFRLAPFITARPDPKRRAQLGIDPSHFVVGMIARLFKLKGHDDLLDLLPALVQSIPHLRLLLVGDGAWRSRLESKCIRLGVRRHVVFAGLVEPGEIPGHLALMNALVHLSRREGLPRALPQALATGIPVVAYDCDGAREVCLDGETGFLITPGDRAGVAKRIEQLQRNPDLRQRLGTRGRELVARWFPLEKMVDDLDALYRRLLAAKGSVDRRFPTHPAPGTAATR